MGNFGSGTNNRRTDLGKICNGAIFNVHAIPNGNGTTREAPALKKKLSKSVHPVKTSGVKNMKKKYGRVEKPPPFLMSGKNYIHAERDAAHICPH